MEAERLDAFLVTHLPNVFYLSGFTGSNAALLISATRATLFTDPRYSIQARCEASGVHVRIVRDAPLAAASSALPSGRMLRVGFEASKVTVSQRNILSKMAGKAVRWTAWDGRNEAERMLKDSSEIANMRDAAAIACSAWKESLPLVKPGVRESDLAAELEYRMRRNGAEGPAFETIIASGKRSAWPHARASRKPIEKNELVVFDLGAILGGYSSDLTRTVFVGRAPARVRGWYRAVLEAQQAARSALQPGVTAGSVDAAARGVLRRAGLGNKFIHSTGHGLGLEVHERPRLGRGEKAILHKDMVVTIEPGVYVEGQGGIRIEDDALVTQSGAEFITNATRELIEIG
jgi:Xaa-Pro aminopeptidase